MRILEPALSLALLTLAAGQDRPAAESRPTVDDKQAAAPRDPRFAETDAVFAQFTPSTPGCVLAVAEGGRVLYTKGYGSAVLEHQIPLTPASLLDIGSTAKQVTASCVVLLSLEGKLTLDDAVGKHVPDLGAELAKPRIRQLLTHTSGIPDYIALLVAKGKRFEDWTTGEDALEALSKVKTLDFAPGSKFAYSNSNYFLLSQVVESVSSRPLKDFARERFFAPLGMTSTRYVDDHRAILANRASSYSSPTRETLALQGSDWEQNGDGGLWTTAGDLVTWTENLTAGRVGGEAYVKAMTERGRLADGTPIAYGMGLMFGELDGRPIVSHAGGWAAFRAECLRVPERCLTVVCLSNWAAVNPTALAKRVARIFLRD